MKRIATIGMSLLIALIFVGTTLNASSAEAKAKSHSKKTHSQKKKSKSAAHKHKSKKHRSASNDKTESFTAGNFEPIDRKPASSDIPATGYRRAALYMARHDTGRRKKKRRKHIDA